MHQPNPTLNLIQGRGKVLKQKEIISVNSSKEKAQEFTIKDMHEKRPLSLLYPSNG